MRERALAKLVVVFGLICHLLEQIPEKLSSAEKRGHMLPWAADALVRAARYRFLQESGRRLGDLDVVRERAAVQVE